MDSAELLATYKVDVPEGQKGRWSVQRYTVTQAQEELQKLQAFFSGSDRFCPAGEYTRLVRDGSTLVMSDTPDEIRDHLPAIERATGDVLIFGLGLGMVTRACLLKSTVTSVTVVELDQDVIDLVAPSLGDDPRLTIVCADAFAWKPHRGARYDLVWVDIWDTISDENVSEMRAFRRRYRRRSPWVGCWAEEQCRRFKRTVLEGMRRSGALGALLSSGFSGDTL